MLNGKTAIPFWRGLPVSDLCFCQSWMSVLNKIYCRLLLCIDTAMIDIAKNRGTRKSYKSREELNLNLYGTEKTKKINIKKRGC